MSATRTGRSTRTGRTDRTDRRPVATRLAVLTVAAAVMAFPLYWITVTALQTSADLAGGRLPLIPTSPTLDAVRRAFTDFPIGTWFGNSIAIAVVAVALTVVVDLLAGYALAKYRFPGRTLLFLLFVSTLMIPVQALIIPQFDVVVGLGWVNSYWAVIIPRAAEAFGIFLVRQYMLAIPDELLEAAALDGAGALRTFGSVVLPLCRPLIAVLVVFTFMYRWNEFAWPLVVLRDPGLYTLPIGLAASQGQFTTDYPLLMTLALLSTLPVLAVFVVFQRSFVAGVARSGLR